MEDHDENPRKRPRIDDGPSTLPLPAGQAAGAAAAALPIGALAAVPELTQDDQEHAVGISAYVSGDRPGFRCIVKQRYTDFLVNEILPNGRTAHLVDLGKEHDKQDQQRNGVSEDTSAQKSNDAATGSPSNEVASLSNTSQQAQETATSTNAPQSNGEQSSEAIGDDENASYSERKQAVLSTISEEDKTTVRSIFGEAVTTQILGLYCSVKLKSDRKARDHAKVKSDVISEKSKRTEAHIAVRRIFESKLETATLPEEPGVISIRAAPTRAAAGARGRPDGVNANGAYQKGKLSWSQLGGEYLHFTLYKENKDTMEVLYFIASELKVPAKNFQFAGTKDRRGVTVQRVAIYRVHAERMAKLNRTATRWRVGSFEYKPHGLELGDLGGNEFVITLRDCRFDGEDGLTDDQRLQLARDVVSKAGEAFGARGFLNYFGLQRFGTFSTGTHTIGMKMLKGDLKGAVESILSYSPALLPQNQDPSSHANIPQDDINRADAIHTWHETHRSSLAIPKMPRRFQAESAVIQYLGKTDRKTGQLTQEHDWQGALSQIPRNLRMMYVHAYQSFVWNTAIGKRWELYGEQVVEGDLVIVGEKDDGSGSKKAEEVDEDGEPIIHPGAEDKAIAPQDSFTRARPLSKAEAESGRYNIFDIALPLPGFDVLYPSNIIGKFYEEFMSSELGGELDPHNMRRAWKDISLSGDYRKMMSRPGGGFSFQVKSYAADDQQMVETDLERLQKQDNPTTASTELAAEGSKIAVVVKLQLGRSQYATMALRELTMGGAANFRPDYSTAR